MNHIQWFPGHMAKARRQIEEKLKLVDIVYELLDARIPIASANPMLAAIIKNKPRLIILNKADLADSNETAKFIDYYEKQKLPAIALNSLSGAPLALTIQKTREILKPLREKEQLKGMKPRPFRAMVLGIPNVGKSQFINRLAGKAKAKTGDTPGVTRFQTYLRAGKDLELLDNPGILWPRFESESVGKLLALVGSIKAELVPCEEVSLFGIKLLQTKYPDRLQKRYNLDPSLKDPVMILEAIGKNRGCLLQGGLIDFERAAKLFLFDLQNQMFGQLTLEGIEANVSI